MRAVEIPIKKETSTHVIFAHRPLAGMAVAGVAGAIFYFLYRQSPPPNVLYMFSTILGLFALLGIYSLLWRFEVIININQGKYYVYRGVIPFTKRKSGPLSDIKEIQIKTVRTSGANKRTVLQWLLCLHFKDGSTPSFEVLSDERLADERSQYWSSKLKIGVLDPKVVSAPSSSAFDSKIQGRIEFDRSDNITIFKIPNLHKSFLLQGITAVFCIVWVPLGIIGSLKYLSLPFNLIFIFIWVGFAIISYVSIGVRYSGQGELQLKNSYLHYGVRFLGRIWQNRSIEKHEMRKIVIRKYPRGIWLPDILALNIISNKYSLRLGAGLNEHELRWLEERINQHFSS